jgi:hypothetical protein
VVKLLLDTGVLGQVCHPRITTTIWRHAAELWAIQRRRGRPTGTMPAWTATCCSPHRRSPSRVIVTLNVRHFAELVDATTWQEVSRQP